MASPAELAQVLPDTLPADFSEWDSEDSPAALPANSSGLEAARGFASVPKPHAQPPEPRIAPPAASQVAPRPAVRGFRNVASPAQAASYTDDERYFRRLRSVTTVVDTLPDAPSPAPSPAPAAATPTDWTRSTPSVEAVPFIAPPIAPPAELEPVRRTPSHEAPRPAKNAILTTLSLQSAPPAMDAMRNTASLEEELMREAARPSARSFLSPARALLSQTTDIEDPESSNRKRMMVMTVAAATVLLAAFQLFHSGTLPMVKRLFEHKPAAVVAQPPSAVAQTATSDALRKSPSAYQAPGNQPASPATGQATLARQVTPAAQQKTSAQPAAVEANLAPPPVQSNMMHDQLTAPTLIPKNIKTVPVEEAPPSSGFGAAGIDALGGNAAMGSAFTSQPQPKVKSARPLAVSAGVAGGLLIKKTNPVYPPIARTARVAGTVVLQATITKTGTVENVHAVSGPAMLRQAAVDAVRSWRYKPYKLDNQPVEIETTVNVIFNLE